MVTTTKWCELYIFIKIFPVVFFVTGSPTSRTRKRVLRMLRQNLTSLRRRLLPPWMVREMTTWSRRQVENFGSDSEQGSLTTGKVEMDNNCWEESDLLLHRGTGDYHLDIHPGILTCHNLCCHGHCSPPCQGNVESPVPYHKCHQASQGGGEGSPVQGWGWGNSVPYW